MLARFDTSICANFFFASGVSSSGASAPITLSPGDALNVQTGFCPQVGVGSGRVLRQRPTLSFNKDARGREAQAAPTTTVTLVVAVCNSAEDAGAYAVSPPLQAQLSALAGGGQGSATPSPGSSPAPSPPTVALLSVRVA